ncbi:MAG TPA: hypothetical protein PKW33_05080 [Anaerolineaceae bacterium]|nr:hypothetical protein [Anaerolineaceae bacterium]HPN50937.1 hypothetical protein [Anaerolineaceae bacterium]
MMKRLLIVVIVLSLAGSVLSACASPTPAVSQGAVSTPGASPSTLQSQVWNYPADPVVSFNSITASDAKAQFAGQAELAETVLTAQGFTIDRWLTGSGQLALVISKPMGGKIFRFTGAFTVTQAGDAAAFFEEIPQALFEREYLQRPASPQQRGLVYRFGDTEAFRQLLLRLKALQKGSEEGKMFKSPDELNLYITAEANQLDGPMVFTAFKLTSPFSADMGLTEYPSGRWMVAAGKVQAGGKDVRFASITFQENMDDFNRLLYLRGSFGKKLISEAPADSVIHDPVMFFDQFAKSVYGNEFYRMVIPGWMLAQTSIDRTTIPDAATVLLDQPPLENPWLSVYVAASGFPANTDAYKNLNHKWINDYFAGSAQFNESYFIDLKKAHQAYLAGNYIQMTIIEWVE